MADKWHIALLPSIRGTEEKQTWTVFCETVQCTHFCPLVHFDQSSQLSPTQFRSSEESDQLQLLRSRAEWTSQKSDDGSDEWGRIVRLLKGSIVKWSRPNESGKLSPIGKIVPVIDVRDHHWPALCYTLHTALHCMLRASAHGELLHCKVTILHCMHCL